MPPKVKAKAKAKPKVQFNKPRVSSEYIPDALAVLDLKPSSIQPSFAKTSRTAAGRATDNSVSTGTNSQPRQASAPIPTNLTKRNESDFVNEQLKTTTTTTTTTTTVVTKNATKGKGKDNQNAPKTSSALDNLSFKTVCRPIWDEQMESHESGGEMMEHPCGSENCMCEKLLAEHPDWPWVFSTEGEQAALVMMREMLIRDWEAWGIMMCDELAVYGIIEVVDNWLNDFNKEMVKKRPSPWVIWPKLEGLSQFLQSRGFMGRWFMSEDVERTSEIVYLIGTAVLASLTLLNKHSLLTSSPSAPIKNISLIMAMFVNFAEEWVDKGDGFVCDTEWTHSIRRITKLNGIKIGGPWKRRHDEEDEEDEDEDGEDYEGYDEDYEDYDEDNNEDYDEDYDDEGEDIEEGKDEDEKEWEEVDTSKDQRSVQDWKEQFEDYVIRFGNEKGKKIGGTHFTISKMCKRDKKEWKDWNKWAREQYLFSDLQI